MPASISTEEMATSNRPTISPITLRPETNSQSSLPAKPEGANDVAHDENLKQQPVALFAVVLGAISSVGGFIFGYESGQISGKSL